MSSCGQIDEMDCQRVYLMYRMFSYFLCFFSPNERRRTAYIIIQTIRITHSLFTLLTLFEQATTITQLYTLANKGKQAAKKQGYQIALEELWTFAQSKNSTTISIDDLGNWIRQKYQAIGEEDESNTNNIPIIETQFQNECGKRKWNDGMI